MRLFKNRPRDPAEDLATGLTGASLAIGERLARLSPESGLLRCSFEALVFYLQLCERQLYLSYGKEARNAGIDRLVPCAIELLRSGLREHYDVPTESQLVGLYNSRARDYASCTQFFYNDALFTFDKQSGIWLLFTSVWQTDEVNVSFEVWAEYIATMTAGLESIDFARRVPALGDQLARASR